MSSFKYLYVYKKLATLRAEKSKKMIESKQTHRDAIDAGLMKTKTELAIAKHREMKLCNQIKGMTKKEEKIFYIESEV